MAKLFTIFKFEKSKVILWKFQKNILTFYNQNDKIKLYFSFCTKMFKVGDNSVFNRKTHSANYRAKGEK